MYFYVSTRERGRDAKALGISISASDRTPDVEKHVFGSFRRIALGSARANHFRRAVAFLIERAETPSSRRFKALRKLNIYSNEKDTRNLIVIRPDMQVKQHLKKYIFINIIFQKYDVLSNGKWMRKQTEREENINIIRTHFKVNKIYILKKDYILGIIEMFNYYSSFSVCD